MSINSKNIRYAYFRVGSTQGNRGGFVCSAILLPPKGSTEDIQVAFSFCSPKDNFQKRVARQLAYARLDSGKTFPVKNEKAYLHDIAIEGLCQSDTPRWLDNAFRDGIVQSTLTVYNASDFCDEEDDE